MTREARASQQKHFAHPANAVGLGYWLPLSPHPGFVDRERFEPGLGAALIQPWRVLDRSGPSLPRVAVNWVPDSWERPPCTRTRSSR